MPPKDKSKSKKRIRPRRQRAVPQMLRGIPPGCIQYGTLFDGGERLPHSVAASTSRRRRYSSSSDNSSGRDSASSTLSVQSGIARRPSSTPLPSQVVTEVDDRAVHFASGLGLVDQQLHTRHGSTHVGSWEADMQAVDNRGMDSGMPYPQELEFTGAGYDLTQFSSMAGRARSGAHHRDRGHELHAPYSPRFDIEPPNIEGYLDAFDSVNQMEQYVSPLPPFHPPDLFSTPMDNTSGSRQFLQHISGPYPSLSHEAPAFTSPGASSFDSVTVERGVDRMALGMPQMHGNLPYHAYDTSPIPSHLVPQGMVPVIQSTSIQGFPHGTSHDNLVLHPDSLNSPSTDHWYTQSPPDSMRHDGHFYHSN